MPAVFAMNGIQFLRRLLSSEGGTNPDGRPDPGWCCFEHSLVASLALSCIGIRPLGCEGKLIVGSKQKKEMYDVAPHYFLSIGEDIFDSAISYENIEGLPPGPRYPNVSVAVFTEREPLPGDWKAVAENYRTPIVALYAIRKTQTPDRSLLGWEMDTPLGKWLTKKFGKQAGLWGRAAWAASEVLAGSLLAAGANTIDWRQMSKDQLWEAVAALPEKDSFVGAKLRIQ